MDKMMEETKIFFNQVCLEINKYISVTNTDTCEKETTLLGGIDCCKYLGITETGKVN